MPEFLWKWRREFVFVVLVVISLGMLVSQQAPGLITRTLHQGLALVLMPFQGISSSVVKQSRNFLTQTFSIKKLQVENKELLRQVERLTVKNTLLQQHARENETLRQELNYQSRVDFIFRPSEIIGRDPGSWLQRAVVDRGAQNDVVAGAGVISPQGVVGRISQADLYSASVMFILDSQSSVAGIVARSQVNGTVKGYGQETLKLMYVSSEDDVQVGDEVVTSKLSALFPAGIPIGRVVRVGPSENGLMLDIDLEPAVNFKTLDRCLILIKED